VYSTEPITVRDAMIAWLRGECRRYAEHAVMFRHDPTRRAFSEQCWRKAHTALRWWRQH